MTTEERLTHPDNHIDEVDGAYLLKNLLTIDGLGGVDDIYDCSEQCTLCEHDCESCCIQKAFNRLAEYENTGLSPHEIAEPKNPNNLAQIDTYDGLKRKYIVLKSDTGEGVENCFVLRPDKDPAAIAALRAYAKATDNKALAADIINWVGAEKNEQLTNSELIRTLLGIDDSMTDEQLTLELCELRGEECDNCPGAETCKRGHYGLLDWLRKPQNTKIWREEQE